MTPVTDVSMKRCAAIAALGLAAVAAGCADDSSPLNVVPTTGAEHQVVSGTEAQTAVVNTAVPTAPRVRVRDEYGNPVPGVWVEFEVTAGDGSVDPARDTTDADGEVGTEWTLGTVAGENALVASIEGVGEAQFEATGVADVPGIITKVGGDTQTDTVGRTLADTLVIQVADEYGNLTAGVEVQWHTQGIGTAVTSLTTHTDSAGRLRALWTLGHAAGAQAVQASAGTAYAAFAAEALPDQPAELRTESGDGQSGAAGDELVEPLVVALVDRYGNGVAGRTVAWAVTAGTGTLESTSTTTNIGGLAQTRYTLGTTPGMEEVTATFDGLPPAVFSLTAGEQNNIAIHGYYITQATQRYDGTVPLVQGRDGYLRVFGIAEQPNVYEPTVEVRFYHGGTLVRTDTITKSTISVGTTVSEASLGDSWNLFVPGSLIQPGLGIALYIDPDNRYFENNESDNRVPAGTGSVLFDVRLASTFRARMVPVYVSGTGTTGDVDDGNVDEYMAASMKMFPIAGYDVDVRSTYTSTAPNLSTHESWVAILEDIADLRTVDGSARYYYGMLGYTNTAIYCGLGYIGYPAGIGLDLHCGGETAAHEWGHNFERYHTPCGDPANPDPYYPYDNASIGVYGLDAATAQLKSPGTHADFMSYCDPTWISDYTYEAILSYRAAEAGAQVLAAAEPSLIVSGRVRDGRLELKPVFQAVTVPRLPDRGGAYRLEGIADDGTTAFSVSFDPAPIADIAGDHRYFSFAIPLRALDGRPLQRIRFVGPGAAPAELTSSAGPAAQVTVQREADDRVRLEWDADRAPLVVVRDPRTGDILSFARGGSALIRTDATELELDVARGLETARQRVGVEPRF